MDRKQVLAHQVWMLWLKETKAIICRPIFRQMYLVQCCFIPSQGENIITIFWFENYTAQSVWNLKCCCYICKKKYGINVLLKRIFIFPHPSSYLSLLSILFSCSVYYFHESTIFSCEFRLSKGKKMKKCCIYNHGDICICFTSLTLVCKLSFIQRISPETNMSPLISQMLAFLCALIILTIKIF